LLWSHFIWGHQGGMGWRANQRFMPGVPVRLSTVWTGGGASGQALPPLVFQGLPASPRLFLFYKSFIRFGEACYDFFRASFFN